MQNAKKQARHRHYKKRAIAWYEEATGFPISEVIKILKLYDIAKERKCDANGCPEKTPAASSSAAQNV